MEVHEMTVHEMTYLEKIEEKWRQFGFQQAEKGLPYSRKFDSNSLFDRTIKTGFEKGYNEYIEAQQRQK